MEGIKEKEGEVIALEGERRRGGGREGGLEEFEITPP